MLSRAGNFINESTILADGPAGNSFTIAVSWATVNGTFEPGYVYDSERAQADTGKALKIDNIGSFGGGINGFSAGDTIDIVTSLAVGTVEFSATAQILDLEHNGGTILAPLLIGLAAFASGKYGLNNGTAAVAVDLSGPIITGSTGTDGVGNTSNVSIPGLVQTGSQTDTTAPTISSITETPSNGELAVGAQATLSLTFSEPVTVAGGTPTLTLDSGGTATYSGGSGSSTLSFTYTVGAGQNTTALAATAVNLNGATITDSAGTEANLSLAGVAQDAPTIDTYNDGSAKAPAGTPQLPNLLAGLVAPPWQVAGVNYAVGVPSGTTLLNPATISMAGVSVNTSSEIITITGSNVTLNGYNFGLGNGWSIDIASGATNTVIENSSFVLGSNENVPIDVQDAGSLTILDNTFNGNDSTSGDVWAMVNYDGSGTVTAEYNLFENTPADAIDFGNGNMTTIVEYNLFENLGAAPGAHADTVQYAGTDSTNSVIAFNTVTSGEEGIQLAAQAGSTLTDSTIDNNVVVAPVGPSVVITFSIAVQQWSGTTINGVVVDDNYLDYASSYGPFYAPTGSNLTYSDNVNMTTGAIIASPSGTSSSDVSSVTAFPASGLEAAGSTITLSLHMDEVEFVTGTPTLALSDGGTATYVGGSGTATLVFSYTVASTNEAESALAIIGVKLPTGASISDANGNAANLASAADAAPDVVADSAVTPENQAVSIAVLANDTDPGGTINPASVAVSAAAAHGTTTVNAVTGAITYTPTVGFYGTDTFQYTVDNTLGIRSAPATVAITVSESAIADAPTLTDVWTGAVSADFANAGNWDNITDGSDPATAVPGVADVAQLTAGGGTITGTGTVAQLQFGGTGPWVVTDGASLSDSASFSDTGTLTIQDGATIDSTGPSVSIGNAGTGSISALTVTGTGSSFIVAASTRLTIGATGNGSLSVTNGGGVSVATYVSLGSGAVVSVDSSSSLEIGTAGTAAAGSITVDASGGVYGDGTLAGSVVNNGYVTAYAGNAGSNVLEITGALTGSGWVYLESGYNYGPGDTAAGAVLQLDSAVTSSQTVDFFGASEPDEAPTLQLTDAAAFAGTLDDFDSAGDALVLVGQTVTGASISGSIMTVTLAAGGPLTFDLAGVPTSTVLMASGDEVMVVPPPQFAWTGAQNTNFADAPNWNDVTDGLNPATMPPGATDIAQFTSNGGTISGTGSVAQLQFGGTSPWVVTGGANLSDSASFSDTGMVSIQDGATIDNTGSSVSIGNAGTSNISALTVTGTGSSFIVASSTGLTVGTTGNGSLSVTNGGRVSVATSLSLGAGAVVSVDSSSSLEIGTAGTAAAGSITVDASDSVYGDGTLAGSVDNNGYVNVYSGSTGSNVLEIAGALTGTGWVDLESGYNYGPGDSAAGAVLRLDSAVAKSQTVDFDVAYDPTEAPTLQLADAATFAGTLADFDSAGDTLELVGQTVTGASIDGSTMTVTLAVGGPLTFNLASTPTSTALGVSGDEVIVVPPAQFVWTGAQDMNFANALNWNDVTDDLEPPASPPDAADTAQFQSDSGGTIIGIGSVDVLRFDGTALWTLTSAATLVAAGGITVGASGSGALAVEDGATIASAGTVDIVSGEAGGAAVSIDGPGAAWTSEGGLVVGEDGSGAFTISGQASASSAALPGLDAAAWLGLAPGDTGSLTVTGAGSSFTATGQLDVGVSGAGSFLVDNGGTAATGDSSVDPTQGFDIASAVGGSGQATVAGNASTLTNDGRFLVGDAGLGSLAIESGATVVTTPGTAGLAGAVIAAQAGSDGSSVNVTGAGSNWQIGGALDVGNAAEGSLNITAGGSVSAGSIDTGVLAGSFGDIVVNGTASQLTATGQFTVGDSANADMAVSGGATIDAGNFDIGLQAGASGVVDVEGTSVINVANAFNIGDAGNAVLSLGADATVNTTSFNIGTAGVLIEFGDPINSGTVTNSNSIVVNGGSNVTTATDEFVNNGLVEVENSGTETINTPLITGTGSMQLSTDGDLVLNADSIQPTQTIVFADATGTLTIGADALGGFDSTISGFQAGDQIIVQTTAAATFSQNGSIVSVIANGTTLGELAFANTAQAALAASTDGALADQVICFCAGTQIATPSGEVAVEQLAVGDVVLTHRGEARPITWIGVGRVLATRGRRSAATPVVLRKGALADNVPHHDLRVTKGHSFYLDGVLIPVEFLVNHRSIEWDDRAQEVILYHLELASHDVLLANGALAESYRDDGNRWLFRNANSGWALPPQVPCAPVLTGGAVVDAVWRRLLERAGPRPSLPLTDDPDLHVLMDGQRLDAMARVGEAHVFHLPAVPSVLRIMSRAAVPAELGLARDPRVLGVALRRLVVRKGARFRVAEANDDRLTDGFHAFEAGNGLRWTDGDAAIQAELFAGFTGPLELVLQIGGVARYPADHRAQQAA